MTCFSRLLAAFASLCATYAAEPFFKPGDVVALVGGEDMVVASEYGYLELLLTRALPDHHLRFRNLAWEGDTVFEQHRDLNFPMWEEQLDKVGATVVIAQFGQMESLAGKEKLPEFIAAYEKLLERFSGGGKRWLVLLAPSPFEGAEGDPQNEQLDLFREETAALARRLHFRWIDASRAIMNDGPSHRRAVAQQKDAPLTAGIPNDVAERIRDKLVTALESLAVTHRDSVHLSENGHRHFARVVSYILYPRASAPSDPNQAPQNRVTDKDDPLRSLIVVKNRLWFDYWRPQNWAFLAGDRTEQPSSRDWRDPSIRWFPPEREEFLPLIAAKEKQIWDIAAKLSKP